MSQGTILSRPATKWAALAALVAVLAVLLTVSVVRAQVESTTVEHPENSTDPVAMFTATDPEGETPVEWFIVLTAPGTPPEGFETGDYADAEDFDIDKKTGALTFDVGGDTDDANAGQPAAPDYENPGDTGTDNTYNVVVAACDLELASDGTCPGVTGYHKVAVKVIDMDEQGTVTLDNATVDPDPLQYLVGVTLTATAKDGDIQGTQTFTADVTGAAGTQTGVSGVTWRWYRGGTQIPNQTANTYALQPADAGQYVKAVAYQVVDGATHPGRWRRGPPRTPCWRPGLGTTCSSSTRPRLTEEISEGDKGRNVGAPVTVKAGSNHGAVAYTLTGTVPTVTVGATTTNAFEIDRKTGQIKTLVALDYDGTSPSCPSNTCTVMVRATDASGAATDADTAMSQRPTFSYDATVTIKVTNVDEKPVFVTDGTGPGNFATAHRRE